MYWVYFPKPKPIQMAADGYEAIMSWKSPINMTRTSVSTVRTKSLLASFVQRVFNMYSNSCVCFFVVASLHIARASACDNRFVWGDVYFLVLGKLKVWNSACQERKESFLFVLSCRNVFQFRGILVSGRIFDTICLVCIPNNVHPFTWLEMIQNEWDEDVFSIAIKSGNSCGWKSMNNSCSIKDLAVIKWRWIRLFGTSRLNTRQEVWPLSESQLSKLGQRWWVGLVFVHKKFVLVSTSMLCGYVPVQSAKKVAIASQSTYLLFWLCFRMLEILLTIQK